MRFARRLLVTVVLVSLAITLTQPVTAAAPAPAESAPRKWAPPQGAVLSDPLLRSGRRAVLKRVNRAIRNTAKDEVIRIAVWNYDDRATVDSLLAAHRRGVHVQIVVSNSVDNGNWDRTRRVLSKNRRDRSFAVQCRGGCRNGQILHSKFVLISRVHKVRNISMVGSFNITRAAGNRQWNDLVTVHDPRFYRSLVGTFKEYARDRKVARPFQETTVGRHKITLWPAYKRNPIREELRRVACRVPSGDGWRRTTVRIAIAGWFDVFGHEIARQVRRLWDRKCNVKIVTTLSGRGINQTLRNPRGRGPVPIKQVTIDRDQDGVPERYLHMKAIAIRGGFGGDRNANVLITGSPNWSRNARRSDEIVFRLKQARSMVGSYVRHINRLYSGPSAHDRIALEPSLARRSVGATDLPEWFELE